MTAAYYVDPADQANGPHHPTHRLGLTWMWGRASAHNRRRFEANTDRCWFVEVQVAGRYVGVCWG